MKVNNLIETFFSQSQQQIFFHTSLPYPRKHNGPYGRFRGIAK